MTYEIDWVLISKLRRSIYRTKVLEALEEEPLTPSELAKLTSKQISHVSRTLRELRDLKLIVCLTPKETRGRLYTLTALGRDCLDSLR